VSYFLNFSFSISINFCLLDVGCWIFIFIFFHFFSIFSRLSLQLYSISIHFDIFSSIYFSVLILISFERRFILCIIYLVRSKKSHLDLVNGHFSTQLSAHGPSFAKNVLTGKGVEHRRSKPFVPSLSPQLCHLSPL
jgi:hypothetical protein